MTVATREHTEYWHKSATAELLRKIYRDAVDYINSQYYNNITLDSLIAYQTYSARTVQRAFSYHGTSWRKMILAIRMREACFLLSSPIWNEETIKTISQEVGYESPSQFSRAFKKHCGMSPSEYRRQVMQ